MGGGQAFTIGLDHLDQFAWVGEFSSGLLSDADFRIEKYMPGLVENAPTVNQKLKLLFLSCGSEEGYRGQFDLRDSLARYNIRHEWYTTPGNARVEGAASFAPGISAAAVPTHDDVVNHANVLFIGTWIAELSCFKSRDHVSTGGESPHGLPHLCPEFAFSGKAPTHRSPSTIQQPGRVCTQLLTSGQSAHPASVRGFRVD
jgi:hypothetical protein